MNLRGDLGPGGAGGADTDSADLIGRNFGGSADLANSGTQSFPGLRLAKANDVAAAGHRRREYGRFVSENAAGFGAAAVDSEIVGHRASSNTGSDVRSDRFSPRNMLVQCCELLLAARDAASCVSIQRNRLGLNRIDLLIIAFYLAGITLFGLRFRKRQRTMRDYFLADRNIPWWAISLSIVAAETSTLTIISIPGLAYDSNLTFLQVVMGYVIGRVIISFVLLPQYFRGELYTAYQLIERRFGPELRR